jgi:hypothetical protein
MVPEARLEPTEHGLVPKEGWFVLNALEARWKHADGERETTDAEEAYARVPAREPAPYRAGWLPA